jgi:hypothetical protein
MVCIVCLVIKIEDRKRELVRMERGRIIDRRRRRLRLLLGRLAPLGAAAVEVDGSRDASREVEEDVGRLGDDDVAVLQAWGCKRQRVLVCVACARNVSIVCTVQVAETLHPNGRVRLVRGLDD